jgi:Ca-activated chloride channel family protein
MRTRRMVGFTVAMALGAIVCVSGQVSIEPRARRVPKEPVARPGTLRTETKLVLVPVTVTDARSRPVVGLEKEHFRIFDNKVEQTITAFSMEDEPVAVGFVFDTSGSMGGTLGAARSAAQQFFINGEPDDEYCLVEFDSRPRLVVPLTGDTHELEYQLMFTHSGGSTALLDAVYLALTEMRKSKKTKKALVIISDGGDNHSRYSEREVKNLLRETDTLIYSVATGGDWAGENLLKRIAEETGGLLLRAEAADYSDIAKKIVIDLRNRYVLGYVPQDRQTDGKYHRVQVQLLPPRGLVGIRAHWRLGYYAPEN